MNQHLQQAAAAAPQAAEQLGNEVRLPFTGKLGLGEGVRGLIAQARRDHLAVHAGNVAYHALFATFPSLLALLWLLRLLPGERLLTSLLTVTDRALPTAAAGVVRAQLMEAPGDQATGAITIAAVLAVLVAVWSLSSTFRSVMAALNAMYAVEERRSAPQRYGLSLLLSLGVAILLAAALGLALLGGAAAAQVAETTGGGWGLRLAWSLASWLVMAAAVLVAFGLVYYFAPDVDQRLRWVSPGAVAAVLLWVVFAVLFSLYVNHAAGLTKSYGLVAGFVVLMTYVYGSAFILLLGAEVNQLVEMRQPDGKNEGDRAPSDGVQAEQ